MTYHNECLLDYSACTNGVTIKADHKGPCPLGPKGKNENVKSTQSHDFVTDGDDDEDNTSENREILRDTEGKKENIFLNIT